MAKKSAKKSANPRGEGKPFKKGGDSRQGRGPKKGAPNAGRPPQKYIEWCKTVVSSKATEAAVKKVLASDEHPQFSQLYGKLADRAYGRPMQSQINFPVDLQQCTREQVERIRNGEDPLLVMATSSRETE